MEDIDAAQIDKLGTVQGLVGRRVLYKEGGHFIADVVAAHADEQGFKVELRFLDATRHRSYIGAVATVGGVWEGTGVDSGCIWCVNVPFWVHFDADLVRCAEVVMRELPDVLDNVSRERSFRRELHRARTLDDGPTSA